MSVGGGGEIEELSQQLQAIETQIETLRTQAQALLEEQSEVNDAIEAIERLETGSTVQVPLGGGASVRAEIADIDEIIVDIGGGYATERNQEQAISILEDRHEQLDEREDEITDELADLESRQEELSLRAQQLQQQQMQQSTGGLGTPGDGDTE